MRFKIGQEVVCTCPAEDWTQLGSNAKPKAPMPKRDEIVTIERYSNVPGYIVLIEYNYYSESGGRVCFEEDNFEPLANISELQEILEQQPETV